MINIPQLVRRTYRYRASVVVYIFIGGLSAVINWIVFYGCYTYLEWHYGLAAVAAFVVATAVNFYLSENFGFLSDGRSRKRLVLGVYIVSIAGFFVDILALAVLFNLFNINIMVAKIVGTAAAFVVNFGGRQFFVFVRHPRWPSLSALGRGISRSAPPEKDKLLPSHDRTLQ